VIHTRQIVLSNFTSKVQLELHAPFSDARVLLQSYNRFNRIHVYIFVAELLYSENVVLDDNTRNPDFKNKCFTVSLLGFCFSAKKLELNRRQLDSVVVREEKGRILTPRGSTKEMSQQKKRNTTDYRFRQRSCFSIEFPNFSSLLLESILHSCYLRNSVSLDRSMKYQCCITPIVSLRGRNKCV
jgi:hypothetical protein